MTQTDAPSPNRRRRIVGFAISSAAMITYCIVLGWIIARTTDSPVAAFGSAGFASIVGVWALYLRFFRVWPPERVLEFRKRLASVLLVALKAMGIATLLFILYLMARNN
jgi:hypothetical protein